MKPEVRYETRNMMAASLGRESSVPDLLGEMVLQNELKFALDEEDEIYEGYGRCKNAYPYRQYNNYSGTLSEKEIRTAVVENDYLKAVFLPEYGGRLWELRDKKEERNLLYTNDVLQFRNLAVRNAWFSGGVEWNIGVIGHTPLTTQQMYVAQTELENGTPVLRMYEYERIRGVVYQMDFWLEEDSRFLNCRMRIVNDSADVVPMYWWSNIAVPEFDGGRIVVPAQQAYTNRDKEVYRVGIPMVDGIDVTAYGAIPKSVDYFFDIPAGEPKYIANFDRKGYGLLHLSTDRLRSRKLFSWGHQDGSDRWQEFLARDAGRYIEIQAGLAKTQYGCIPMAPHTAWEWMELYGAAKMPEELVQEDFQKCRSRLTQYVRALKPYQELGAVLKHTKKMAKTGAELIACGSGYGALATYELSGSGSEAPASFAVSGSGSEAPVSFAASGSSSEAPVSFAVSGCRQSGGRTDHLTFVCKEPQLLLWKRFFDTGILHCPDPLAVPDAFLIDKENLGFMERMMRRHPQNQENWYAQYQLGLGYLVCGRGDEAEEAFSRSISLKENPWAYHARACRALLQAQDSKWGDRSEEECRAAVSDDILRGMRMVPTDVSYLKEGFRILSYCGSYGILCDFYNTLTQELKRIGKLRFLYASALHHLGQNEQAYAILEENGGLEIEDIREGEDSIGQLFRELSYALTGEEGSVPHKYNFQAF